MQPAVSVITIAVNDLPQAVDFYRQVFGLTGKGIVGDANDDTQVAFMQLAHGQQLALWPKTSLQRQTGVECSGCGGLLSRNLPSTREVDDMVERAQQWGATLTKAPHWQPWGCYGAYLLDLDGQLWELTYNLKY